MEMTLEQYILNPMGKNNAVLNAATREIMRKQYMHKFDNLMLRENGRIEYYLYYRSSDNTYWAHIKVPSETVKKFYYDVVLKFYTNESGGGEDLFKYNVKFYSNDPSFVFTYAKVFAENDLFIRELASKMSKKALKEDPKEKNPGHNVGYVKTIFFAYLLLQNRNLKKISRFMDESKPLDIKYLISQIENADDKIEARQEEGKHVSHRKKVQIDDKGTESRFLKLTKNSSQDLGRLQVTTTKRVGSIKNSAIKSTARTKTSKRK